VVAEQPPTQRLTLLVLCFGIVGLLSAFSNDLANVALTALGKDPDLTGRTEYWDVLWQMMAGHWTLGYGYFSGFLSLESVIAEATKENFGSTHNGYLDILVSLGIVGLTLGLAYLLWLFVKGIDFILRGPERLGRLRVFPICIVVYALQHNLVESSILAGNTLVPLVLAVAAGSLARANLVMDFERISDRGELDLRLPLRKGIVR
jgi:O-antigen ligase